MQRIVTLNTNRYTYDITEASACSITVKELISLLENEDLDAKIVFSNDNGYTYGYINEDLIHSGRYETREETELRENMENLRDDLLDLNCDYEHEPDPEDEDDKPMTEEEYQAERELLFITYGVTEEQYAKYFAK